MILITGNKYLFMGQRYCFVGTVKHQTPTHVELGPDAIVVYEDIGPFEEWAKDSYTAKRYGPVPGQIVCMLGCDVTPISVIK